jgi:tellurite resistance protein TerC
VLAIFGIIVLVTAVKMILEERKKHHHQQEEAHDYSKGGVATFVKKFLPVSPTIEGHDFFTRKDGKLFATALFLALIVIEISDILFAVDSIPAILSISQDIFIVFSSNIFAILGLRALYFVLEAMGNKWKYISHAVIGILFFIGIKMLVSFFGVHIESGISLAVILLLLAGGIGYSMFVARRKKRNQ